MSDEGRSIEERLKSIEQKMTILIIIAVTWTILLVLPFILGLDGLTLVIIAVVMAVLVGMVGLFQSGMAGISGLEKE